MIVAFTKDWDDVPTCTTHILREMAKTIPVLWVSSIGTRKPTAASGKDLRRLVKRVLAGFTRAEWKENKLRVLKPILIPKAQSSFARWLNRKMFAWYLTREVRDVERGRWGVDCGERPETIEHWCFVPNAVDLLPASGIQHPASRTVYYCADDWTQFHNLDGEWMGQKERELVERADVVFVTSRFLENKLNSLQSTVHSPQSTVHYMPHGVEYERFARALDKSGPIPRDVAGLPKPVVGFYGNLHPWVDVELVAALASKRPGWPFVLIGEVYTDVTALEALPNVHLLGRREHSELHNYCRAFDMAIIPYDMSNPRMESVNPVKTKELLAAGLPIVAADVPELRGYGQDVLTCTGADQWLKAMETQLERKDCSDISSQMAGHDWSSRIREIRTLLDST